MRYIAILAIIAVLGTMAYAAETSVSLDRCVILNHPTNQAAESMAAVYFDIPDSLLEKEILYVELGFSFTLQSPNDSSLYEFMMYPAIDEWSEETIDYEEAIDLADSLMTGSYTVRLSNQNEFHVDITKFVFEIAEEERTNYGLIVVTDLLGDDNLRLPTNIGSAIINSASVRVIYK
jgi:hypothetical protein